MTKQVKEFVQVETLSSLDRLIAELTALRDALPEPSGAEVRLRGCDVFGRHIAISYMRPQTPEEAEREARYDQACRAIIERQERERATEALRNSRGHLRAAA